jgi:carbamate kinase
MRIVVALGGNALLRRGERPDAAIQLHHVDEVAHALAELASEHELVVVHGNGPQVGLLALESEADTSLTRPYPLSDLVAETQGLIGLWLQQALANAGAREVVTLVTQTVVDPEDPAFVDPTKFIGQVYAEQTARAFAENHGWSIRQDGGGWRRVVPSPMPHQIVEIASAERLLAAGATVTLAGGGGVPVVYSAGGIESVEAVVDKDHVAALAAELLEADLFVVLTDVPGVMVDFGTAQQRVLRDVTADQLQQMSFPEGSMGPKAAAACHFAHATGRRAAIGTLAELTEVVAGRARTHVRVQWSSVPVNAGG